VTETTAKKTKRNNKPAIYEMACDVTSAASSLDKNGRLVSIEQADTTTQDDNDLSATYSNAAPFGGYSAVTPVQVSQEDSKPQMDKKRAGRTAQQGTAKTCPGDGSKKDGKAGKESVVVMEEDRKVCNSANDTTLVDNALYVNASVPEPAPPSSSSAAAAAAAASQRAADETICTSNNDFTLIDNAIYNN